MTVRTLSVIASVGVLILASATFAQSPEEHASHHPGAAPGAAPAIGAAPAAGGMGGMMEGMGEMMKGMHGVPPPKELYPTLMALPELSPEERTLVEAQASERMHAGSVAMGQALDTLNAGTQSGDYAAMHEAITRLREGTAQLESGIAARRALAEGRAPREVAMAWFKQEMNLTPGTAPAAQQAFGGMGFHLIVIALLAAFAVAMIAMYFFKMRRAHALLARLANGGSPPAAAEEKPATTPAADKPAAPAEKPAATTLPAAAATSPVYVTFRKSGKTAALPADKCILEAAESVGVTIEAECRAGTCGTCKVKLLSGAVTMEIEDALSAEEKASGTILACQAKSTAACAVDA